jgi:hypothetical protein
MRILNEQEETLVLNDICARLIHGVKIAKVDIMTEEAQGAYEAISVNKDRKTVAFDTPDCVIHCYRNMEMVKPYLRSMSSMTEEERKELKELHFYYTDAHVINDEDKDFKPIIVDEVHCSCIIDWLNAHHFDYRGLIERGLAIKVTPDNNPYE